MAKFLKKDIFVEIMNYVIFIFVIGLIVFAISFSSKGATNMYVEDITDNWSNYYGKKLELDRICEKAKIQKENKFYATYNLERKVNKNYTLVFRASSCFVNVYVDGKLVSIDDDEQNEIFGRSAGHRWHMVSINSDKKSCKISLEVKPAYNNGKGSISNVYIGSPQGVVKQVMWDRIVGFLISMILVVVGIMLCAIYWFAYNKQRKAGDKVVVGKIIPMLGFLTIMMGIYSSLETYFWQFFVGKSHFFQLMSYVSMFMISVLIGVIAREVISEKRKIFGTILYWLGIIMFFLATILNFSGILEYYYIMKVVYIYCALLSILIFIEGYVYIKNQETISKMLLFGVCFFSVTFACDCIRYLSDIPDDICAYTRVGFLVFIVCILIEVCSKSIDTIQKGALAELYKKMAATDTLTALNNRNELVFDECKYNELLRNKVKVAVAMFDVNNLKYVNDHYGHAKGDQYIKTTANILSDTFGKFGKCYRTGGDEFVCVLVCEEVESKYKETLKRFLSEVKKFNKTEKDSSELEVAYGVYMSDEENFTSIWQKADGIMYDKKKEMKANR